MNELSIGVVAGLVASLIVFAFQVGYVKVLRPWIEEMLYRDVEIEGSWLLGYPENEDFTEAVELKRRGHRVTGVVTVTGGADKGRVYILEGSFKNLILTVSFSGQDASRLDRGTYTLQATNNAQHLHGYSTYYQDDENCIACLKCNWIKR